MLEEFYVSTLTVTLRSNKVKDTPRAAYKLRISLGLGLGLGGEVSVTTHAPLAH